MPGRLLNQVSVFQYVTLPKAPTYRAIIQVFYEAKQHYVIELRADDVLGRLQTSDFYLPDLEGERDSLTADERRQRIEDELERLVHYGNLAHGLDLARATSLKDFHRTRYVYRLTAVGESAHRAVLEVEATVGRSGSLQTAMLVRIRETLDELAQATAAPAPRPELLLRLLHDLNAAFDTLTSEAGRFLTDLDRYTEGQRTETGQPPPAGAGQPDDERFILQKQAVLAYISGFVEQLRRLASAIGASLEAVRTRNIERLLAIAVTAANLPPALAGSDPTAGWLAEQAARWQGICCWFIGHAGSEPTVDRLRALAVSAVIKLTRVLGRLNERRASMADRTADFRSLARWFQRCEDDVAAQRLYQAAFGLYCARHLHIEEDNPSAATTALSFWEAKPIPVPIRLRSHGQLSHTGRPAAVRDHSSDKQWVAACRRRERELRERAFQRFTAPAPICVSDLGVLEDSELDAFLLILAEGLSAARDRNGTRRARTPDGRYIVTLEPPPDADREMVMIVTPRGRLRCRDYRIRVEQRFPAKTQSAEAKAPAASPDGQDAARASEAGVP
ncbi:MAG TPA: TIGR02677 family protein [Pseudomonadota bacterium]|nr:TIGR02677 family protein [Pseudomonadota bacterium]